MPASRFKVLIEWDPADDVWVTYVPKLNHLSTFGESRRGSPGADERSHPGLPRSSGQRRPQRGTGCAGPRASGSRSGDCLSRSPRPTGRDVVNALQSPGFLVTHVRGSHHYLRQVLAYEGVRVLPRPVTRPHPPIWVGTSRSDDTFRWAGKQAFHLMTLPYMYEPPVLRHWIGIYREALEAAGHDPSSREILGKFHI